MISSQIFKFYRLIAREQWIVPVLSCMEIWNKESESIFQLLVLNVLYQDMFGICIINFLVFFS